MADITQILSINSGSSSIKFALFAFGAGLEEQQLDGAVERIGQSMGTVSYTHLTLPTSDLV